MRGFLCVAIHGRGRILGTLSLGRQIRDAFSEREVALVEATADQIGIALDNARLYSETVRQLEELRRTQAQLVHAEKLSAVGELASGVAHEINNPLTTILGQAHLLLDHSDVTPHVRDRVKIIADEASAGGAHRAEPPALRPPLSARAASVLARRPGPARRSSSSAISSSWTRSASRWTSCRPRRCGRTRIRCSRWCSNLVQNAHQAMVKQDGERVVTMRTRAVGATVLLEVLDTGPGIEPEALSRLFDPFFTTKPPGEGSGLGLSVSYGIVTEHKGRLRGENRTDRRGAIFTVELPAGEVA